MGKIVVFIRHTDAQNAPVGGSDADRKLTEKGISDAKKTARSIQPIVKEYSVRLICSPLTRALETAKILGKKLDLAPISEEWVATGKLSDLHEAIETLNEEMLLVVGHEPTLSQWIESVSDVRIPMKKGASCALEFAQDITDGADLLWYLDKNAVPWHG
jgi:phosphohistidine phosphatase